MFSLPRMFDLLCCCAAARSLSSGVRNSLDLVCAFDFLDFLFFKVWCNMLWNWNAVHRLWTVFRAQVNEGNTWWATFVHECITSSCLVAAVVKRGQRLRLVGCVRSQCYWILTLMRKYFSKLTNAINKNSDCANIITLLCTPCDQTWSLEL